MMKKIYLLVVIIFLTYSADCAARSIFLKTGDMLNGEIQDSAIRLQTPYGSIIIDTSFLETVALKEDQPDIYIITSINNDYFSGRILNDTIEVALTSGNSFFLEMEKIAKISFKKENQSHEMNTTLFFMKNGDKFSGRYMNKKINFMSDFKKISIQRSNINRIQVSDSGSESVKILNTSGEVIYGEILDSRIQIEPDSIHTLFVCKENISAIQFNVKKLFHTKRESSSQEAYDSDGDSIPNAQDGCPDTPCLAIVDKGGCSPDPEVLAETDAADETGKIWILENILFDFNKQHIKPQYHHIIDTIIEAIQKKPTLHIAIHGHTDNLGSEEYNLELSENRARAVMEYMIEKGLPKEKLSIKGFGFSKPKMSNSTAKGREANRRVEIVPGE